MYCIILVNIVNIYIFYIYSNNKYPWENIRDGIGMESGLTGIDRDCRGSRGSETEFCRCDYVMDA